MGVEIELAPGRALFVGDSANKAARFLIERRMLSEKTQSQFAAIYEIPKGYLLRISEIQDFEGAGRDNSSYLYACESAATFECQFLQCDENRRSVFEELRKRPGRVHDFSAEER